MAPMSTVFGCGSPVGEDECGDFYGRAMSSWSELGLRELVFEVPAAQVSAKLADSRMAEDFPMRRGGFRVARCNDVETVRRFEFCPAFDRQRGDPVDVVGVGGKDGYLPPIVRLAKAAFRQWPEVGRCLRRIIRRLSSAQSADQQGRRQGAGNFHEEPP